MDLLSLPSKTTKVTENNLLKGQTQKGLES